MMARLYGLEDLEWRGGVKKTGSVFIKSIVVGLVYSAQWDMKCKQFVLTCVRCDLVVRIGMQVWSGCFGSLAGL